MDNPIISVNKISYVYSDGSEENNRNVTAAIENVSFDVRAGEYISILGHNGSGKSTLAKLLNMILVPSSGKIYIDGVDITDENFTENDVFNIRQKVGMVFQNPDNQLVATVVDEDVAFGPENLGLPRDEIKRRVKSALSMVGMTEYAHHAPHKLSGGQKQRVAIAGIIAMRPRIIIFDESTAMLDPLGRREVVEIMERLNRDEGITILNITHYMDEAARADRVIVINDGSIVMDGSPKTVFSEVGKLREIGLEAPQGRELIYELGKIGFDISTDALSEAECIEALKKFVMEKKSNEHN